MFIRYKCLNPLSVGACQSILRLVSLQQPQTDSSYSNSWSHIKDRGCALQYNFLYWHYYNALCTGLF
jgi:hypothetical protein